MIKFCFRLVVFAFGRRVIWALRSPRSVQKYVCPLPRAFLCQLLYGTFFKRSCHSEESLAGYAKDISGSHARIGPDCRRLVTLCTLPRAAEPLAGIVLYRTVLGAPALATHATSYYQEFQAHI